MPRVTDMVKSHGVSIRIRDAPCVSSTPLAWQVQSLVYCLHQIREGRLVDFRTQANEQKRLFERDPIVRHSSALIGQDEHDAAF